MRAAIYGFFLKTQEHSRMPTMSYLYSRKARSIFMQIAVLAVVVTACAYFFGNAAQALRARGLISGFQYLWQESGFAISESLVHFSPSDHYGNALLVGLLNTLKISLLSIVGASVLGLILGLMRLSSNWALTRLATLYVEIFRNTPQLLQIIFWYGVFINFPAPRQALNPVEGVFVSNRGLSFVWFSDWFPLLWVLLGFGLLLIGMRMAARYCARRGRRVLPASTVLPAGLAAMLLIANWQGQTLLSWPSLQGLNFRGGITLSPEFCAIFIGLTLYIAAFIAEIVRSGVQSVPRGQIEAARSICLTEGQIFRRILLPQALRVMIPPLAGQYASLVKNSSLAVAIGYPDLVNISNTTMNQSGHVVETICIMTAVYLLINLLISVSMNFYNKQVAIKER